MCKKMEEKIKPILKSHFSGLLEAILLKFGITTAKTIHFVKAAQVCMKISLFVLVKNTLV